VIFTATLPLLLRVIFLGRLLVPTGWLPNFKLAGVSCTYVPVPFKLTLCGLSGALSVMESAPVTEPALVGLKVTVSVQLFPGFTVDPQLLV
jgi:hypothetical protein